MKPLIRPNTEVREIPTEIVASLSQTGAGTDLQFHSASGGNRRTAKRPASQQPVVRQRNPNPNHGRALRVVAGGALGAKGMDLDFPQFAGIASRRDAPLAVARGQSLNGFKPASAAFGIGANSPETTEAEHKTAFAFEHQPVLRDTGIND